MVLRIYIELEMAFQAITANENRLRSECNRLGEKRQRYRRERDESVALNATHECQVVGQNCVE